VGLDALRKVLALRTGQPAPAAEVDALPTIVVIEGA
jgi:hypothetical protein